MMSSCTCLQALCSNDRSRSAKARQPKCPPPLKGGFVVQVRDVPGCRWTVEGLGRHQTVLELRLRLQELDKSAFATHRVDLIFQGKLLLEESTLGSYGITKGSVLYVVFSDLKATALVLGGGVAGRRALEDLATLLPTEPICLVDSQDFSEHANGILQAFCDPSLLSRLVLPHQDLVARYPNVHFVQARCLELHPGYALMSAMDGTNFALRYKYCVIATGCSWAPSSSVGGGGGSPSSSKASPTSLPNEICWKPSSVGATAAAAPRMPGPALRRDEIEEEHAQLQLLNEKGAEVLIIGADYQGVEFACFLRHYFPRLRVTLADGRPRCLCAMPEEAAEYAQQQLWAQGVRTVYGVAYEPDCVSFWEAVQLQSTVTTYIMGNNGNTSAVNDFMPQATLSARGPSGGGWIITNQQLQVCCRRSKMSRRSKAPDVPGALWASGMVFAVGDCHLGAVWDSATPEPDAAGSDVSPSMVLSLASIKNASSMNSVNSRSGSKSEAIAAFALEPMPKGAFPAIACARLACQNIAALVNRLPMTDVVWPREAGIVGVRLGPDDGVLCWKVQPLVSESGEVALRGADAARALRSLALPPNPDWLATPSEWLPTLQRNLPAWCRWAEGVRSILRTPSRAW